MRLSNRRKSGSTTSGRMSPSTASTSSRRPPAVTPQQYTVSEFTVPPYSSQIGNDRGAHFLSDKVKSSKPCETSPLTTTSLWLYVGGSACNWQASTVNACGLSC